MTYDVLRPGRSQHRMVDSRSGRTDRPEVGKVRRQPRPLAEADDREMRQPAPSLRLVHAEPLEAAVEVGGQASGRAAAVVEHEHADAPRLAVAAHPELDRLRRPRSVIELGRDPPELACWAGAEKGEREVEVLPGHEPSPCRRKAPLPGDERVENGVAELEREEEA